MFRFLKTLSLALFVTASAQAFAAGQSLDQATHDRNEIERGNVCYDFDYDPNTCAGIWYCRYDYRSNTCNYFDDYGGGGGGGGRWQCRDFDGDRRGCQTQRNCVWDQRYGTCDDYGSGGGGGSGNACNYQYDQRSCEYTRGCSWDYRWNTCVDDNRF